MPVTLKKWLFFSFLILLALPFINCTGNQDGDDDQTDDDTDSPDDDSSDDDSGTDDDDDTAPPPFEDLGWMLLCGDQQHALEIIDKAPAYGVDRIVLSHGIIEDIDQIPLDQDLADLVTTLAARTKQNGMKTHVWVHELSGELHSEITCFDPADNYWELRRQVYRQALTQIPDIDGVNITMGSGNPPPWFAMCICPYCLDLPPYGHFLMDLLNSHPDERVQLVVDTISEVVTDELAKEVVVHSFYHDPDEVDWLRDAFTGHQRTDYRVLTKNVPNDWQPYYPPNPLFGDVGDHEQIVSFDLGGEYWGNGILPFCEVDHIQMRLEQAAAKGIRAINARVERGCEQALGSLNEVNLYALSRLAQKPDEDPQVIWRDWIQQRFGLATTADANRELIDILAATFDVGRKMYYVEGFWTFIKGSDFPDTASKPEMLVGRANSRWDPDWNNLLLDLSNPSEATLSRIWQEKTEAVFRAQANLTALEGLSTVLSPDDLTYLRQRLTHQWYATRLWRLGADAIFRYQLVKNTGNEKQKRLLEGTAQALSELADEVEDVMGPQTWPGRPAQVREFLADLRGVFPVYPEAEMFGQIDLTEIRTEAIGPDSVEIFWTSSVPTTSQVEYGIDLPDYGFFSEESQELSASHQIVIKNLAPATRYYYRVHSTDAAGTEIISGDYRFKTTGL